MGYLVLLAVLLACSFIFIGVLMMKNGSLKKDNVDLAENLETALSENKKLKDELETLKKS